MHKIIFAIPLLLMGMLLCARSIYFDNQFLLMCAMTLMIGWSVTLFNQFTWYRYTKLLIIASCCVLCYGIVSSIFFAEFDRYVIWSFVAWCCCIESKKDIQTIVSSCNIFLQKPILRTILSCCVVVWLRQVGVIVLKPTWDDVKNTWYTAMTFDRITTYSTWQILTSDDWKSIVSTGILPISWQNFFDNVVYK
jgi:hypothetical protein